MVNNSEFAGGNLRFNPFASINDGLIEISYTCQYYNTKQVVDLISEVKTGIQVIDPKWAIYRGKNIRMINKNKAKDGTLAQQLLNIDGEDLTWDKFIHYECKY